MNRVYLKNKELCITVERDMQVKLQRVHSAGKENRICAIIVLLHLIKSELILDVQKSLHAAQW